MVDHVSGGAGIEAAQATYAVRVRALLHEYAAEFQVLDQHADAVRRRAALLSVTRVSTGGPRPPTRGSRQLRLPLRATMRR
jgi:hypothetical protein